MRMAGAALAVAAISALAAGCGSSSSSAPIAAQTATTASATTAPATTAPATTAPVITSGSGATLTVSGPGYDGTFDVTACTNAGETDLRLTGSGANGETLTISAVDGAGTLAISGGDEQDSVALDGSITTLSVGDAGDITGAGSFSKASLGSSQTAFSVTGSCASGGQP